MTLELLTEELNGYLRIDDNEELILYRDSAIQHLKRSGVKKPTDLYKEVDGIDIYADYRLAVCMLATHWYENRLVITPTMAKVEQAPIPYGLESMILQLKWIDVE